VDEYEDTPDCVASRRRLRELGLNELLRLRLVRDYAIPSPAAGAEWSATPPAGTLWELLAVRHLLVTSAVVANRGSTLTLTVPGGTPIFQSTIGSNLAASLSAVMTWSAGYGAIANLAGFFSTLPTPPLVIPNNYTLRTATSGLDAGDQYSSIEITVREWSTGAVYWGVDQIVTQARQEAPTPLTADDAIPATLPGQPAPPAAAQ